MSNMVQYAELPQEYLIFIDAHKDDDEMQECEVHHILPKCVGGDNSENNLVRLSVKNHFLAHLLLAKLTNNPILWHACHAMLCTRDKSILTDEDASLYEEVRRNYRERVSKISKENWKREDYRGRIIASVKENWTHKEYREKRSKTLKNTLNDPAVKKRKMESAKKLWENETYRLKALHNLSKASYDKEIVARRAKTLKKTLSTPEAHQKKIDAANKAKLNPNYTSVRKLAGKKSWETRRKKLLEEN